MTVEQITSAILANKTVIHTHMGISAKYKISGVITRYDKHKGWLYSLELRDLRANCVVIAPLDETEVIENE